MTSSVSSSHNTMASAGSSTNALDRAPGSSPEKEPSRAITPPARGAPPAGGPPGGRPQLKKFSYGFFDPEIAMFRGIVFKILAGFLMIVILVMWACLPFYWGSLWKSNHYTHKLAIRVIDRDGGPIGAAVSEALLNTTNLHYFKTSPDEFPTIEDIHNDIVQEGAWGSVVINTGASAALEAARASGDASYDPTTAISFVYAQARQENAMGSYIIPLSTAALGQITGKLSAQSVAQFLQANANNATAISTAARAPRTISSPIFYSMVNIRPYDQPVATAITLVGLIYLLIFSFICTMAGNGAREVIAPYLTTKAYLLYRIVVPMIMYIPLSLSFAMISLPFKIHFGAHFPYAGGWFLWWVVCWLTMAALGFATEFFITLLGPKFVALSLIPWIIVNVSVVSMPHELQPWIFRYGVAVPFYQTSRIVRTIILNTKNEIGRNIGILIAWAVVSIITMSVATWLFRRSEIRQHKAEADGELDHQRNLPDGRVV